MSIAPVAVSLPKLANLSKAIAGSLLASLAIAFSFALTVPPTAASAQAPGTAHSGPVAGRGHRLQVVPRVARPTDLNAAPVEKPGASVIGMDHLSFGAIGKEQASAEKPVTFSFNRVATLGSIDVLTKGSRNKDFTDAGTGTCRVNRTYATGETCTVDVRFSPSKAGSRTGAVQLLDENGGLISSFITEGSGTRAQLVFLPGTLQNASLDNPEVEIYGVAVDGSGNIFTVGQPSTTDSSIYLIKKSAVAVGSYSQSNLYDLTSITNSDVSPNSGSIAVDGAGNVWVPDSYAYTGVGLYKFTASSSYSESYFDLGGGILSPNAVAFDGSGNMYIADYGDGTPSDGSGGLYKLTWNGSSFGSPSEIMGGEFIAVAVDGNGNVYASYTPTSNSANHASIVYKWPSSLSSHSTVASGFVNINGIAVDPAGNVYLADDGSDGTSAGELFIEEYNGGSYSQSPVSLASTLNQPEAVAVDGDGNVYVPSTSTADSSGDQNIYVLNYTTPPTLSFGSEEEGNKSGAQTFEIENIGNAIFTVSVPGSGTNPSPSGGYLMDSSGTCSIVSSGGSSYSLASNSTCTYAVDFDPNVSSGLEDGTVTITDNSGSGTTQSVQTTGSVAGATHFVFSGVPTTAVPGTSFTVTVTAENSSNGTDTGYAGTVHFTSTDGSAALPSNATLTNGTGTFNVTLNTLGSQTVTATDTNATGITATTGTIDVQSPAATHFSVSAPGGSTAGVSFGITVTALTATNATATGYTGTVHFTSSDGQAVLPADATLTNGVGSFNVTFKTAGNNTVTATDTVTPSISGISRNVTVSAAAPASLSVVSLVGPNFPNWTSASIEITAYDAYGNVATSDNDALTLTSSSSAFSAPNPVTLVNGVAGGTPALNVALGIAGSQSITATDNSTALSGTLFINVLPGAATQFAVSAPSSAYAGAPISVMVTAEDIWNNVATGYTGTAHFTSSDSAATLPGDSTLTSGTGTFSATFATAGSQTITATDTVTSTITGTSGAINVTIPNLVVNVSTDDAGTASNCTVQTTPGTNGTDSSCSLRDALLEATSLGTAGITFDSTAFGSAQTITLSNGTLPITSNTTVTGPTSGTGASLQNLVTIDGGGTNLRVPVFTNTGATNTVLQNLIITDGYGDFAGGIYNQPNASLTVRNCAIVNNGSSISSSAGGIYSGYASTLLLVNSTLSGNQGNVGALDQEANGTATVENSTLSGNTGNGNAGGIYISYSGQVFVTNSTITGNTGSDGGGIAVGSPITLSNTIVAGNSATDAYADIYDPNSFVTDAGGNLISSDISATSLINPNLAPLGSYGGPTQTMLPLPGSAAICSGLSSNLNGLTTDQRGGGLDSNCLKGGVDAGAVQTNYAITFSSEPKTSIVAGTTPSTAVTVTESNAPLTASSVNVPLTLNGPGTLTGGSASTVSGVATYAFSVDTVGSGDTLTATLSLNPGLATPLSISTTSNSFDVIDIAAPTFNLNAGIYAAPQNVVMTSSTQLPGIYIHYTFDGSTPTLSSPYVANGGSVTVPPGTSTLQAFADYYSKGSSSITSAQYTITVPAVSFSIPAGTYTAPESVAVTLSNSTPGTYIRFTVDGTTPTLSSHFVPNGGSITLVPGTETVQAVAEVDGQLVTSTAASATYTVDAAAPTFDTPSGNYSAPKTVTLSSATTLPNTYIHYTFDGSTPTLKSPYVANGGVVTIPPGTSTLQAIADVNSQGVSSISTANYTVTAASVQFGTSAGTYIAPQTVTLTLNGSTSNTYIRYTLNGTTPSLTSYFVANGGSVTLPAGTSTLQAVAEVNGQLLTGTASSATYTVNAPAPSFSSPSGPYASPLVITVTSATGFAKTYIHYTLDGSTPTLKSPYVASGGTINIPAGTTTTLNAIADVNSQGVSTVTSATYTVGP